MLTMNSKINFKHHNQEQKIYPYGNDTQNFNSSEIPLHQRSLGTCCGHPEFTILTHVLKTGVMNQALSLGVSGGLSELPLA